MLTRSRYAVQQRLAEPNLGTSFSQAWPQLSAVQVHAKRGLRVPVACVLHAANDGLDATAEDEVVCGVTVELSLPSSRGIITQAGASPRYAIPRQWTHV
jgi:hypothetical protein